MALQDMTAVRSRGIVAVRAALVAVLCLAASACGNSKISKENYDQIKTGMTLKEVEDLLGGPGTKEEGGDGSNVAGQFGVDVNMGGGSPRKSPGETYVWESGDRKITVFFDKNGKVSNKTPKGL